MKVELVLSIIVVFIKTRLHTYLIKLRCIYYICDICFLLSSHPDLQKLNVEMVALEDKYLNTQSVLYKNLCQMVCKASLSSL